MQSGADRRGWNRGELGVDLRTVALALEQRQRILPLALGNVRPDESPVVVDQGQGQSPSLAHELGRERHRIAAVRLSIHAGNDFTEHGELRRVDFTLGRRA